MRASPRSLLVVVRPGPLTRAQREERHLVDHVPQRLVASKAELDEPLLLATPLRHGHGSGVRLQMPKRLPPPGGVPQTCPQRRRRDSVVTDRDRPGPLRRRHAGEKILDRLPVFTDCRHHYRQLRQQSLHQPGLSADHVQRHGQLRLLEDPPEFRRPSLAQPMRACPALPLAFREGGHSLWSWIGLQELPRQRRRQLGHLQGPHEGAAKKLTNAPLRRDVCLAALQRDGGWKGCSSYALGPELPGSQRRRARRAKVEDNSPTGAQPSQGASRHGRGEAVRRGHARPILYDDTGRYKFVEVKKGTDRLRPLQLRCLAQIARTLRCEIEVVYLRGVLTRGIGGLSSPSPRG